MIWESFNSKQWTMEIPISFAADLGPSVELFSVHVFQTPIYFIRCQCTVHSMRIDSTDHRFFLSFHNFRRQNNSIFVFASHFFHSVIWYRIVRDKMNNEVCITTVYVRRRKCENCSMAIGCVTSKFWIEWNIFVRRLLSPFKVTLMVEPFNGSVLNWRFSFPLNRSASSERVKCVEIIQIKLREKSSKNGVWQHRHNSRMGFIMKALSVVFQL